MAVLCPCPKNFPEAKLKSNGLISLVEEVLRKPNIDSIAWLLVITLMQIYYEKEQVNKKITKHNILMRK